MFDVKKCDVPRKYLLEKDSEIRPWADRVKIGWVRSLRKVIKEDRRSK